MRRPANTSSRLTRRRTSALVGILGSAARLSYTEHSRQSDQSLDENLHVDRLKWVVLVCVEEDVQCTSRKETNEKTNRFRSFENPTPKLFNPTGVQLITTFLNCHIRAN